MTPAIPCAPQIGAESVTFRLRDPSNELTAVKLRQEITRPRPGPEFIRRADVWQLTWERPPVDRLEYALELVHRSGDVQVICDPGNPRRAPGPFGDRSVVEWPEYRPPRWTEIQPEAGGDLVPLALASRTLGTEIDARIWTSAGSPVGRALPLLVVHDGPEYDAYSSLLHFLRVEVESGRLPPMRAALLAPVERDHAYSASARYARAFGEDLLPELLRVAPTPPGRGMRIGMGSSLGALAMLHIHRTKPATFGALVLQSGSYFRHRFDPQESSFVRFRRVTRFVGTILSGGSWAHPIPVAMTCGSAEENIHNNRAMRDALVTQGYDLHWQELRDAHNWISWRDSFEPALGPLLGEMWT